MKIPVNPDVKGLIFDIDGTLADTMPFHYLAWKSVAEANGYQYPIETFFKFAGMPTARIFETLNTMGYHYNVEESVKAKNEAYLRLSPKIEVIQPVFDVVKEYHGKIPMSLGTGEYSEIAAHNLKASGLDKYFSVMVAADDISHPKPDPETFLKCAELMGVPPARCQVFEDGDLGLEAARRAGMTATDVRIYIK